PRPHSAARVGPASGQSRLGAFQVRPLLNLCGGTNRHDWVTDRSNRATLPHGESHNKPVGRTIIVPPRPELNQDCLRRNRKPKVVKRSKTLLQAPPAGGTNCGTPRPRGGKL